MGSTLSLISTTVLPPVPYVPTLAEINMSLAYLTLTSSTAKKPQKKLPVELGLIILDYAEYWTKEITESRNHLVVRAGSDGATMDRIVCTSTTIQGEGRVESVKIMTDSRDQGWSSYPAYHHTRQFSSSYFTVALLRPIPTKSMPTSTSMSSISSVSSLSSVLSSSKRLSKLEKTLTGHSGTKSSMVIPIEYKPVRMSDDEDDDGQVFLHYNVHAARDFREEVKVFERSSNHGGVYNSPSKKSSSISSFFSSGSEDSSVIGLDSSEISLPTARQKSKMREERFIQSIRKGDIICVYACAKYAGWINEVRGCRIEVSIAGY